MKASVEGLLVVVFVAAVIIDDAMVDFVLFVVVCCLRSLKHGASVLSSDTPLRFSTIRHLRCEWAPVNTH